MTIVSSVDDWLLAILTGGAFGGICWWLWRKTPGRIVAILVLLWILRPLSQQLLSLATGGNPHILDTAGETAIFAVAAAAVAWLMQHRKQRGTP